MTAELVRCTADDVERLRDLMVTTFIDTFGRNTRPESLYGYMEQAYDPATLANELGNADTTVHFLMVDHEIAGYLKLNITSAQTETVAPDGLEIQRIYLLRQYQGRGFGQILVQKALDEAVRLGRDCVWLGVWEFNPVAQAFYRKHGFERFGEHTFMMGNEAQTDLLMRRPVNPDLPS